MDTTDIDKMNNLPFVRLYVNKRCGVDGGHLVNAFVNPKISALSLMPLSINSFH
jgi:hypothetical protein